MLKIYRYFYLQRPHLISSLKLVKLEIVRAVFIITKVITMSLLKYTKNRIIFSEKKICI